MTEIKLVDEEQFNKLVEIKNALTKIYKQQIIIALIGGISCLLYVWYKSLPMIVVTTVCINAHIFILLPIERKIKKRFYDVLVDNSNKRKQK